MHFGKFQFHIPVVQCANQVTFEKIRQADAVEPDNDADGREQRDERGAAKPAEASVEFAPETRLHFPNVRRKCAETQVADHDNFINVGLKIALLAVAIKQEKFQRNLNPKMPLNWKFLQQAQISPEVMRAVGVKKQQKKLL
jgi:hypothetical protein